MTPGATPDKDITVDWSLTFRGKTIGNRFTEPQTKTTVDLTSLEHMHELIDQIADQMHRSIRGNYEL